MKKTSSCDAHGILPSTPTATPVPLFGTAGLSESYAGWAKQHGYKNALGAVPYTRSFGLDAFEYQSGRGVRISDASAAALSADAAAANLQFSMHAPYYISMSGLDDEKRLGSLRYFLESAAATRKLGGRRVIFHAGSAGKQSRAEALARAQDTLARARAALDEGGYEDILLCPETMGKEGQLGTLDEVLALCQADARHVPCIDFGHLNARTGGSIRTKADYAAILDAIGEALGDVRAEAFHVHFSKIEYTAKGEKRHLTFADTQYGPDWQPLVELVHERSLSPVIICESDGTQAEDAHTMRAYYASLA